MNFKNLGKRTLPEVNKSIIDKWAPSRLESVSTKVLQAANLSNQPRNKKYINCHHGEETVIECRASGHITLKSLDEDINDQSDYIQTKPKNALINFSGFDIHGLSKLESALEASKETIKEYGVGSCGPRNFFGTCAPHLSLEKALARILGYESCVFYASGLSAVASSVACFISKSDLVFADEMVNQAILKGIEIVKPQCFFFKNNDSAHLEDLILKNSELGPVDQNLGPLCNRALNPSKKRIVVLVEGISANTGQICSLPRFINLKKLYNIWLIVDESLSFGTLGDHGIGMQEYYDIKDYSCKVNAVIGQTETVFGISGGYTCCSEASTKHQILTSASYVFSASSPPFIPAALEAMIEHLINSPQLFSTLKQFSTSVHKKLIKDTNLKIFGSKDSPIKHITFLHNNSKTPQELRNVCRLACEQEKFALSINNFTSGLNTHRTCIRIILKSGLDPQDIKKLIDFFIAVSKIYTEQNA